MRKSALIAAGFHLAVTTIIYLVGRLALLPQFINEQGIIFADSRLYQSQMALLADILTRSGPAAWTLALLPLHIKLYSLCFVTLGWLSGASVLTIEPLNAAFYLIILYLVFRLSHEVFERKTAMTAAGVVALWPTLLLYTTQPLRDPLFLTAALLFLLLNLRWLTKTYSLTAALRVAAAGVGLECLLWLIRSDMWELMSAIVLITCAVLAVRMAKERRIVRGNAVGACALLLISLIIPKAASQLYGPVYRLAKSREVAFANYSDAQLYGARPVAPTASKGPQQIDAYLPRRINALRERFIARYPEAGSNIDTGVRLRSTTEVVLYLPRAMMVGLFAPFPQMWFANGAQTGRVGRLVTGAETLVLYVIELMALYSLWRRRSEPCAWWLFLIALTGMTALGLVVTNVGALYRLRCVFIMPLVILACDCARRMFSSGAFGKEVKPEGVSGRD
jgi:hypothetical protein